MGLLQGIRLYPKAILWAGLISLCCAMEGYDIALIGNFYGTLHHFPDELALVRARDCVPGRLRGIYLYIE